MNDNGQKNSSAVFEKIFDAACLAASYIILLLLPQKINFLFYLIFGAAAFLFCIGFFRLGFLFDKPAGPKGTLLSGLLFAAYGAVINISGLYGIWHDQGSGRSIIIATLLLIEALVLFAMAGSSFKAAVTQRMIGILFRIAAVLIILFGVVSAVRNRFSEPSVIAGTMLLIEGICLWKLGAGSNPFNTQTPEIQTVPGMQIPIGQLEKEFSGVKTQLGYPWIGRIKTIDKDSIIYGPSEDGFVVYGYYNFGRFYVSGSTDPLFPHPEDAEKHIVSEIPDSTGTLLVKEELPEAYASMFARYAESGNAYWSTDLTGNHIVTGEDNGS